MPAIPPGPRRSIVVVQPDYHLDSSAIAIASVATPVPAVPADDTAGVAGRAAGAVSPAMPALPPALAELPPLDRGTRMTRVVGAALVTTGGLVFASGAGVIGVTQANSAHAGRPPEDAGKTLMTTAVGFFTAMCGTVIAGSGAKLLLADFSPESSAAQAPQQAVAGTRTMTYRAPPFNHRLRRAAPPLMHAVIETNPAEGGPASAAGSSVELLASATEPDGGSSASRSQASGSTDPGPHDIENPPPRG